MVLRVPSFTGSMVHVPLTCGEAFQNEPVFWKKNGKATFNSINFTYVKKKSKSQELFFVCLLYSSSFVYPDVKLSPLSLYGFL